MLSRWFINKVKDKLGDSSDQYSSFLQALIRFGTQKRNPSDVS